MSLLQRNNESRRIPGMKECKMTQEKIKENERFIHKPKWKAPFRTQRLRGYTCAQCHKSFAKQRYLKDHINSVHIESVVCDFCGFSVAKKRRKRMEIHLRAKHNFPAPAMAPAPEISINTSSSTTTCQMRPMNPPPDPATSQSSTLVGMNGP